MKHVDINIKDTGKEFKINRENYAIINNKRSFKKNHFYDDDFV